jgi:DNA relaxase NicK
MFAHQLPRAERLSIALARGLWRDNPAYSATTSSRSNFLLHHRVTRSRAHDGHFKEDTLETAYFGDKGAAVQLRIYDKTRELKTHGTKNWF